GAGAGDDAAVALDFDDRAAEAGGDGESGEVFTRVAGVVGDDVFVELHAPAFESSVQGDAGVDAGVAAAVGALGEHVLHGGLPGAVPVDQALGEHEGDDQGGGADHEPAPGGQLFDGQDGVEPIAKAEAGEGAKALLDGGVGQAGVCPEAFRQDHDDGADIATEGDEHDEHEQADGAPEEVADHRRLDPIDGELGLDDGEDLGGEDQQAGGEQHLDEGLGNAVADELPGEGRGASALRLLEPAVVGFEGAGEPA